ncbi:glycosyltransferase [Arthrobacter sp. SX1312]|uniref:glycosyltransferase n=1 Tax=Arthrobacter sp. SX1312 TaxID=2058896 RepID=UPI002157F0E8|nr:glycosyltransferase [Arthrobacter sp. SX1312]
MNTLASGGTGRRKFTRLESELRVFQGWSPTLAEVPSYAPKARTVLHLLTNSLPFTESGYAQRSHSLLKAQADDGWEVHAATRLGYPVQVGKPFARDEDTRDGVTYHRLLRARMPAGVDQRLQLQAEMLLQLALTVRPSVLHTTTHFVNGQVIGEVARVLGIPWVYEVRGQLADTWASSRHGHAKKSERYRLFKEREAQVMLDASLVVTLGEAMKQEIMRVGVPEERVLLSPNAVGEGYLDEPIAPADARRRLGLAEDGVLVGTVSSLVDYEGLDHLLGAVALLAPEHPNLRCLIVGDGVALPALRALAQELGIEHRVVFTGRVPRSQARLHHLALDVFVVPRKDLEVTRSVTPMKPIEAMACSRPVVASDLPALREIMSTFSGVLVKPEDPAALAAGIRGLLGASGLDPVAEHRARETRTHVLRSRTWAANAAAYSRAYAAAGAA